MNVLFLLTKISLKQAVGNADEMISYDKTLDTPNLDPHSSSRQILIRQLQSQDYSKLMQKFLSFSSK